MIGNNASRTCFAECQQFRFKHTFTLVQYAVTSKFSRQ